MKPSNNNSNSYFNFFRSAVAGGVAGALEGAVYAPVDRIKTNAVAGRSVRELLFSKGTNPFQLWNGAGLYTAQKIAQKGLIFSVQSEVRNHCYPYMSPALAGLCGGMVAGATEVVALQPADVLKVRAQAMGQGFRQACSAVYAEAGFTGFYNAAGPTLIRNVTGCGATFAADAAVAHWMGVRPGERTNLLQDIVPTVAAVFARIVPTQIPERIKIGQQTGQISKDLSFFSATKTLHRQGGLRALSQGLGVRLAGSGFKFGAVLFGFKQLVKKIEDQVSDTAFQSAP